MYPLLGHDDRENMTRVWQHVMPADAFAGAVQLVHQAIGDEFAELARRIPGLAPAHDNADDAPPRMSAETAGAVGARQ